MDTLFDALNSRLPSQGLKQNTKAFEDLDSFLKILESNNVNTFASNQTIESLRVTVKSTLEITEYLVGFLGFKYVLTAKLNQDCLEKFFGLIRGAGGREEHPTVAHFIQLYRLLSIYSPIKRAVRGNITSDESINTLVNLSDSLKQGAKAGKIKRTEIQLAWETELLKKMKISKLKFKLAARD